MAQQNSASYLESVLRRLQDLDFKTARDVKFGDRVYDAVARRTKLELTKSGFFETVLTFDSFRSPSLDALRAVSAAAFRYSIATKRIPLPNGLFESVASFSVSVVEEIQPEIADAIRTKAPPKHFAAFEMPVVVDLGTRELHYYEGTPIWGAFYYRSYRSLIESVLRS